LIPGGSQAKENLNARSSGVQEFKEFKEFKDSTLGYDESIEYCFSIRICPFALENSVSMTPRTPELLELLELLAL
jgi:hypothetical protein